MKREYKRNIFRLITMLSVAAVSILIVFGYFTYRVYKEPFERIPLRIDGDFAIMQDDEIGFIHVPNGHYYRHNDRSKIEYNVFTDHRSARVAQKGDKSLHNPDIMIVGGSYAMGHGLEYEDTIGAFLEEKLDISVVNLSMLAYGTVQCYQMMLRNMDLKPKMILYITIADHIRRNLDPCASQASHYCLPMSYIDFKDGKPFIHLPLLNQFSTDENRVFFRQVIMRNKGNFWLDLWWRMRIDLKNIRRSDEYKTRTDHESKQKSINFLIREMAKTAWKANIPFMVIHIPYIGDANYAEPELVYAIQESNNSGFPVIFLDSTPLFENYYKTSDQSLWVTSYDGHPNAKANHMVCEFIIDAIRNHRLLDTEKPTIQPPDSHSDVIMK